MIHAHVIRRDVEATTNSVDLQMLEDCRRRHDEGTYYMMVDAGAKVGSTASPCSGAWDIGVATAGGSAAVGARKDRTIRVQWGERQAALSTNAPGIAEDASRMTCGPAL